MQNMKRDVALIQGLGSLHFPIRTANPEAQKYFDQGLMQIYGFDFEGAKLSFEQASLLDPESAMPYWGVGLALGPNYNNPLPNAAREKAGHDAIQTAWALASNGPKNEQAYIDALSRRFAVDANPDFTKLAHNYANAICDLSHLYPDDPDAATLC